MEQKIKTAEPLKDYLENINNLLEQDETIEINSVDELIQKFNNYYEKD